MALELTRRVDHDLTVVTLTGELDIYTVAGFRELLHDFEPERETLAFDLTEVTLLDSSGLGALVRVLNQSRQGSGKIGLVCPKERLLRVFQITGLGDAFIFADDIDTLRKRLDEDGSTSNADITS